MSDSEKQEEQIAKEFGDDFDFGGDDFHYINLFIYYEIYDL